jgi:hypothetical protein
MRLFHGAEWVNPPSGPPILLLSSELTARGFWRYTYSPWPGTTVTLTAPAGPAMMDPADPRYAELVADLLKGPP